MEHLTGTGLRDKRQREYFDGVTYRSPEHPVVSAYADPKVDYVNAHVPLTGPILDLGCGNGIFTGRLSRDGASVIGLDLSLHLLNQNAAGCLACGDATNLPFADASFNLVFEANLLHHVNDVSDVLREMHRVSRRYVVLLEPNRYNPLMFAFSVVVSAERGGLKSSAKRLRRKVEEVGLKTVACMTTGMISQNNTPQVMLSLLRQFDRPIWWGEYIIIIAEKVPTPSR